MKKTILSLMIILVAIESIAAIDMSEFTCKDKQIIISPEHRAMLQDCGKLVGVTKMSDFGPENAGCFSKCIMEKKNFLDTDGTPHKENIVKGMDDGVPEESKAMWIKGMEACLDDPENKVTPGDDPSCSSYLPLTMCTHGIFIEVCF